MFQGSSEIHRISGPWHALVEFAGRVGLAAGADAFGVGVGLGEDRVALAIGLAGQGLITCFPLGAKVAATCLRSLRIRSKTAGRTSKGWLNRRRRTSTISTPSSSTAAGASTSHRTGQSIESPGFGIGRGQAIERNLTDRVAQAGRDPFAQSRFRRRNSSRRDDEPLGIAHPPNDVAGDLKIFLVAGDDFAPGRRRPGAGGRFRSPSARGVSSASPPVPARKSPRGGRSR